MIDPLVNSLIVHSLAMLALGGLCPQLPGRA
jgi:hypothetical protein